MAADPMSRLLIDYNERNHPIKVTRQPGSFVVVSNGVEILRTEEALMLEEYGHNPVYYFPLKDVRPGSLKPTSRKTECPYKGIANYYTLVAGEKEFPDSVWQYSNSNEQFTPIKDYVAFYGHAIDKIEQNWACGVYCRGSATLGSGNELTH